MGASSGARSARRWRRSLRSQGLVATVVPAVLVLAYLGVVLWSAQVERSAEAALARTQKVLASATALQASLTTAEANATGYLLGNPEQSRAVYRQQAAAVPGELAELERLTAGARALHRSASQVAAGTDGLLHDLAVLTAVPAPDQATTKAAVASAGRDDALVLSGVANLRTAVAGDAQQQQAAVDGANTLLAVLGATAAALALAGGVVLSLLFTSRVVRRLRRIGIATDALARGEDLGELPGGDDEIGRLSARLAEASALLRQRQHERDAARAELEDLLRTSPVVSFRVDTRRPAVTYASPNVERLLGLGAEAVCADFEVVRRRLHPDDLRWLAEQLRTRWSVDGERFDMTLRFRRDDTSEHWREADTVLTVTTGDDGRASGLVAYLVDATDRHRAEQAAEERRRLLESIIDASPDTITVRDAHGSVVLASRSLAGAVGPGPDTSPDEVAEAAFHRASLSEEDRRKVDALLQRCLAGDRDPPPLVTRIPGPDGAPRIFETRARPVLDGEGRVTGTVTVSRDVTDRARLESSLRRASAQAERASQAKSDFLSRMSHELRTPLNAILGFAQLLELDDLPEEHATSVDQIQRAGRHLLALINEVLDISRIEAGRLSISPEAVAVDDILREVSMLLMPVAESAGVELQVEPGPAGGAYARGDRQRMLQILLNLGSNGVKYNHRHGRVVFRTAVTADGRVRFEVSDTGPGIPAEQQHELFVPFSRLGAERSNVEGTGVGLALSKQLVELMGGAIGVDSVPGRGSTFWVELVQTDEPAAAPSAGAGPSAAAAGAAGGPAGGGSPGSDASRAAQPRAQADGAASTGPTDQHATRSATATASGVLNGAAGTNDTAGTAGLAGAGGTARAGGTADAAPVSGGSRGRGAGGRRAQPEPPGQGRRPAAGDDEAGELVVLHVEDNASNAALVQRVLARRRGIRLLSVPQAGLALELARLHHPDLVLLDLHLPDLPGEELFYRLQGDPEVGAVRVVVLSADATPSRIRRMLALGVEAYLTKPIDVEALLRVIDAQRASWP